MQIRQGNRMAAFRGVKRFIDENAPVLPSVANSGVRTRLDGQIAGLEQGRELQSGHAKVASGLVNSKAALRRALLADHMLPISRIAAADLPHTPELAALRMPRRNLTNEQLIQAADGMAVAGELHSDVFIAAGLPANFIVDLRAAAKDLQNAIDSRTSSRGKKHGATKGIATQISATARTVGVLDALVRKDLRDNADLLADWETVKRPLTKPGRPAGQESTPTPSAATLPTPTKAPTAA